MKPEMGTEMKSANTKLLGLAVLLAAVLAAPACDDSTSEGGATDTVDVSDADGQGGGAGGDTVAANDVGDPDADGSEISDTPLSDTAEDGLDDGGVGAVCNVATNAGCLGGTICCPAGEEVECVSPGACACGSDADCGTGYECCDKAGGGTKCVFQGLCDDTTSDVGEPDAGPDVSPDGGGGGGANDPCEAGTCVGAFVCCATGAGATCQLPSQCQAQGGITLCGTLTPCGGGLQCCNLGSVEGCVPAGTCGGGERGGNPCTGDGDCSGGEICCDPFDTGQGSCSPPAACNAGGGAQCSSDADCGSGQLCCDLGGIGVGLCLDPALVGGTCPGGGGEGGLGTCEVDEDCEVGESCCDLLGFFKLCQTECFGSEGPVELPLCSLDEECADDQTCCDLYQSGAPLCTPKATCELGLDECTVASDCAEGLGCCDPQETGKNYCSPANWCGGGGSDGSCTIDADCEEGQVCCDTGIIGVICIDSALCLTSGNSCQVDADCDPGQTCCPPVIPIPGIPGSCGDTCN